MEKLNGIMVVVRERETGEGEPGKFWLLTAPLSGEPRRHYVIAEFGGQHKRVGK